jgi:hypothetical protein
MEALAEAGEVAAAAAVALKPPFHPAPTVFMIKVNVAAFVDMPAAMFLAVLHTTMFVTYIPQAAHRWHVSAPQILMGRPALLAKRTATLALAMSALTGRAHIRITDHARR